MEQSSVVSKIRILKRQTIEISNNFDESIRNDVFGKSIAYGMEIPIVRFVLVTCHSPRLMAQTRWCVARVFDRFFAINFDEARLFPPRRFHVREKGVRIEAAKVDDPVKDETSLLPHGATSKKKRGTLFQDFTPRVGYEAVENGAKGYRKLRGMFLDLVRGSRNKKVAIPTVGPFLPHSFSQPSNRTSTRARRVTFHFLAKRVSAWRRKSLGYFYDEIKTLRERITSKRRSLDRIS